MKQTSNYSLKKPEAADVVNIDDLNTNFDTLDVELKKVSDKANYIQTAGGTGTAITLNNITLANGFTITFIVASNNNGSATTINGKALYKPGGTIAPNLVAGKAVTVWYNGTNFFIKASAEGTAVAGDVLAGKTFSNDNDTSIVGAIPDHSGQNISTSWVNGDANTDVSFLISKGYYDGTTYAVVDHPSLNSTNIKAGANIFGVSGKTSVVDTADATAASNTMIEGTTAYVNGNKVTGSMPNHAAQTIYCGAEGVDSLKVYAGNTDFAEIKIHPSPNTSENEHIGYFNKDTLFVAHIQGLLPQNIVEGVCIAGSMWGSAKVVTPCAQVKNITAYAPKNGGEIEVQFDSNYDPKIKGIRITYRTDRYPTGPEDGSIFVDTNDQSVSNIYNKTGFTNGVTYYIRIFPYTYQNATRVYTIDPPAQVSVTPIAEQGSQTFTSSGTFTVPAGIRNIQVFTVGGGGGGAGGFEWAVNTGNGQGAGGVVYGGGGGGGYTTTARLNVTPGQQYPVVIGAGGSGGAAYANGTSGSDGSASIFGNSLVIANGGKGATPTLGDGGSGGGSGGKDGSDGSASPTDGGSDGSDGLAGTNSAPGKGQHSTTRAFGETSGALYAGGGGGSGKAGGSGGGGNGGVSSYPTNIAATAGAANTGGGGGGGDIEIGAVGGSGIVIVRWGY